MIIILDDILRFVCIIEFDVNGWRYYFRIYFKL